MKMKSINEWRVLKMAVRGGLLNEDLAALKNMTVDQAEEVMKKNRPDDYAKLMRRSKSTWIFILMVAGTRCILVLG
jgi:hypothetical protein